MVGLGVDKALVAAPVNTLYRGEDGKLALLMLQLGLFLVFSA